MELLAYPTALPKGWISRVIDLLRGGKIDKVQDFHLLWHLTGFAAGKLAGLGQVPEDFSGSDLALHLENCLIKDKVKDQWGKEIEVEREPNWGVVATACRKLPLS